MNKITKKELHDKFTASEESLGVYYGDYGTGERLEDFSGDPEHFEEAAMLPSGLPMSRCTNGAVYICAALGHGDIYGFTTEDNPVQCESINASMGHDFAVIGSRYIVDPWISLYNNESKQGVFDLKDPKDFAEIRRIYGDPAKWSFRAFTSYDYPEDWKGGREVYIPPSSENYPKNKRLNLVEKRQDFAMAL